MVIELKAISLSNQKILEDRGCFIELNDDHIKYVMKFLADEPVNADDKEQGWENIENDFVIIGLKRNISGCERILCRKPTRWRVMFMMVGFAEDIRVYFKKQAEADDFFAKVQTWLLDGDTH